MNHLPEQQTNGTPKFAAKQAKLGLIEMKIKQMVYLSQKKKKKIKQMRYAKFRRI